MPGASRRSSKSVGEGDLLSSTLNLPDSISTYRFSEFNPEKSHTKSRGGSSSIDKRLKEDFIRLEAEISKWAQTAIVSVQTVDVIERQHNAFYMEIEQRVREVGQSFLLIN